jgi:peptidoglycan/LPS O-acetylase OafA/YrhL
MDSMPSPLKASLFNQNYFPSLDGLRGISIIFVIIGHFFFKRDILLLKIFSADLGVIIFFVISGFLITTLLLREKEKTGKISLKKFYVRRSLRIFPVAYLYLFVLLILSVFNLADFNLNGFLSSSLYVRNTNFFPTDDWYTGHYWSLSVEEQFYLLFPILLRANLKVYVIIVLALLLTIPILNYAVVHQILQSDPIIICNQILKHMSAILVGSIFSILIFKNLFSLDFIKEDYSFIVCCFLLFGAGIIQSGLINVIPSSLITTLSSIMIGLFIVINLSENKKNFFYRILNNRVLIFVGVLSYSLYIWQQFFTQGTPWQSNHSNGQAIINFFFLIFTSLVSYYFFERRFLKLKDRYKEEII